MNLLARSACKETRTELSFKAIIQLESSFIPLFYDFFYFWNTKSGLLGGGTAPPTFLEENCFCLSIRRMLKAEYLSFYTLSWLRFLEKYLIENVANAISEPLDF